MNCLAFGAMAGLTLSFHSGNFELRPDLVTSNGKGAYLVVSSPVASSSYFANSDRSQDKNGVSLSWDIIPDVPASNSLSSAADYKDRVPLPASVILIGSGLVGPIGLGIRRRWQG